MLLCLLAVELWISQYYTLAKFNILPPGLGFVTLSSYSEAVARYVSLSPIDYIVGFFLVLTIAALVALEWTQSRLTGFLNYIFATQARTLIFLGASLLLSLRFYLAAGELSWSGDAAQHISYSDITSSIIAQGEWPIWTFLYGTGSPYQQFYGFLFFYLVGLFDQISPDLSWTIKGSLLVFHILSGYAMYFWFGSICQSRRASFFAAMAYALSFWHIQQVLIMGRLPLSLFYAILPLPFAFFERIRTSPSYAGAGLGALSLGCLALCHPGYGFWATAFLSAYVATRLRSVESRHIAPYLVLYVGGLVFGSYLTLPMILEKGVTGLHVGYLLDKVPDPVWTQVLGWSNFRFNLLPLATQDFHWYGGYIGLSLLLGAVLAIVATKRIPALQKRFPVYGIALGLILSLVFVFGYRWIIFDYLTIVRTLSAGRYLLFTVFFLAVLAGLGAYALLLNPNRAKGKRLYTALLLLFFLDLGSTTFQHPYRQPTSRDPTGYESGIFDEFTRQSASYRARGELPPYRIFWVLGAAHPYMAMSRLTYTTHTPTPLAPHPGDLRTVFDFINPVERYLSIRMSPHDFHSQPLSQLKDLPDLLAYSRLLNAKHLIFTPSQDKAHILRFTDASPVIVAPKATSFNSEPFDNFSLDALAASTPIPLAEAYRDLALPPTDIGRAVFTSAWLLNQMQLDLRNNSAQQLFVYGAPDDQVFSDNPQVEVLEHRVFHQKVLLRLSLSAPGWVRLAYGYYPANEVLVDGKKVTTYQTASRVTALQLKAGQHEIQLVARLSLLRRILLAIDIVLIVVLVVVVYWENRSRKSS
jgi:hypothetical protein